MATELGRWSRVRTCLMALALATLVAGGVTAATANPRTALSMTAGRQHPAALASDSIPVPTTPAPGASPGGAPAPAAVSLADFAAARAAPRIAASHTLVAPPPPPLPTPLSEPDRVAPGPSGAAAPDHSGAVWSGDFPDPFVLPTGLFYYAYSTESGMTEVPTLRSSDLVHWQWVGDALAGLPQWAQWGYTWAPSVLQRGASYVMYYTTRQASTGRQCVSRAVSPVPQGPFVDSSSGPMVCQLERGGSIDPSPFVDGDGAPYLVWQSEGTLNGEPPRIWSERLSSDGLSLLGQPTELMHQDQRWEFPIVEGPSVYRVGGRYYLLYSGNKWQTAAYAVGYAVCASVLGPCSKPTSSPLLASRGAMAGPGGPTVFADGSGAVRMAYHAWTQPDIGYPRGARRLHIGTLTFPGGQPSVQP